MSTTPESTARKTLMEQWSDGVLPFMLGFIVALGAVLISMMFINLLIVTRIVYPHA